MKNLLLSVSAASLAISAPALADNHNGNMHDVESTFANPAYVFKVADANGDGYLNKMEYRRYRMHTTDQSAARQYRSDTRDNMDMMIGRSFSALDENNDSWVSRSEFMAANSYRPDYMTITYYLMATPVKADYFDGRDVVNLKGDTVGEITDIIRVTEGENAGTYALIDIDGPNFYRVFGTQPLRDQVGIPLDDLLLFDKEESIMLSTRGEEELRDVNAPEIDDYEDVETLYTLS